MASQWDDLGKALRDVAPGVSRVLLGVDDQLKSGAIELIKLKLGEKFNLDTIASRASDQDVKDIFIALEKDFGWMLSPRSTTTVIESQIIQDMKNNSRYFNKKFILSMLITACFFAAFIFVANKATNDATAAALQNNGPLGLLLGALISAFTTVVQYFFGSSASGNQKDAMLWTSSPPK